MARTTVVLWFGAILGCAIVAIILATSKRVALPITAQPNEPISATQSAHNAASPSGMTLSQGQPEGSPKRHTLQLYGSSDGTPQTTPPKRYKNLPFDQDSAAAWELKYSGMMITELEAARTSIEDKISEVANPILNNMFKNGEGTLIGSDTGAYQLSQADARDICAIQARPGDGVYRANLERDQYPELYQLREESLWLDYAMTARIKQAAKGKSADDH